MDASSPILSRFYEGLSRFSRFVRWDRRGTGLSDQSADPLPLAEQARDLEAIRLAAGFERFALIGYSQGTALAARYASLNPERVSHLVLMSAAVCDKRDPDEEAGRPLGSWDRLIAATHDFASYVSGLITTAAPSVDEGARQGAENMIKASVTPRAMRLLLEQIRELDLRPLLSEIRVPTLVIHAKHDRLFDVSHGRYLAEHIPGARYVEVDSDFHTFFLDAATTAEMSTAIEEFLTGNVVHTADRVMTTVLFTDIVDSTDTQQRMGDDAWRTVRKRFEENSKRLVEQFGGRVVQFTGDGDAPPADFEPLEQGGDGAVRGNATRFAVDEQFEFFVGHW